MVILLPIISKMFFVPCIAGCYTCYADAAKTQVVDSRCIATAPNSKTVGEWFRMKSTWGNSVCNDFICKWRCNANGIGILSDYGPEHGVGDVVACFRNTCAGSKGNLVDPY